MIKKVLAAIAAVAAFAAMFFRGQSIKHEAEAKRQSGRADSAEESAGLHRRVNKNVADVEQKNREEQVDAKSKFNAGDRDHLDNSW